MKILVTGGAGYIGSHTIIDILESSDYEVVSIDNYSNSSPETFDRIEAITSKRVKNYNINLADYNALKREFFDVESKIDGIIHFAALKAVGESVEKPVMYYQNNLNGLINLLKCVHKYHVKNFIFSSSCTVYGNTDGEAVTEQTPTQETESPYGFTKLVGERMLADFSKTKDNFKSISMRYFNPVGAHMSGMIGELPLGRPNNLVPAVTQFASGWLDQLTVYGTDYETRDGTPIRDYIHVSDISHAHVLAFKYLVENVDSQANDVFNLGTGAGVTVLEVLDAFERSTGVKLDYTLGPRRNGDVEIVYANNEKAKTVLNWIPGHSIDDAMSSAWKWQEHLNSIKSGGRVHHEES
jgi:UDP-glucose 4-epimerase